MPNNEIFPNESGLKERVTACRKRLRLNRIHRAHGDNQSEEVFQEIEIEAAEFGGSSDDDGAAMQLSFAEGTHPRNGDTAQQVEGQEVGIT